MKTTVTTPSRANCNFGSGIPTVLSLQGVRVLLLAVVVCLMAPAVLAQHPESKKSGEKPAGEKSHEEGEAPFEIFGGYSYLREDGHGFNGWTGTFIANVNKWFAIAADFDGHYGSFREGTETVHFKEHGFTFGPHVAFHNKSKVTPFVFALFGGAHENVRIATVSESRTGFAANLGGGFDARVNEKVSVRLIQIDAAYTRFDGEGSTSPRISTGLVLHFGKPK